MEASIYLDGKKIETEYSIQGIQVELGTIGLLSLPIIDNCDNNWKTFWVIGSVSYDEINDMPRLDLVKSEEMELLTKVTQELNIL